MLLSTMLKLICRLGLSMVLPALLVFAAPARAALPCTLAGVGDTAAVMLSGARVVLPALLPDCNGARVTAGKVVACVQDHRERLQCRELVAVATVTATAWPAVGVGSAWLTQVLALLRGSVERSDAISRKPTAADVLPEGPVAFLEAKMPVDFADEALADVDRIDFTDVLSGERVASVSGPGVQLMDLQRLLRPGRSYSWTLRSNKPEIDETTQRFTYLGAEERQALDEALSAANDHGSPTANTLVTAAMMQGRGLSFDAAMLLRSAGLKVP